MTHCRVASAIDRPAHTIVDVSDQQRTNRAGRAHSDHSMSLASSAEHPVVMALASVHNFVCGPEPCHEFTAALADLRDAFRPQLNANMKSSHLSARDLPRIVARGGDNRARRLAPVQRLRQAKAKLRAHRRRHDLADVRYLGNHRKRSQRTCLSQSLNRACSFTAAGSSSDENTIFCIAPSSMTEH